MDEYFTFNQRMLATIGVSFNGGKFAYSLRTFSFIVVVVTTFQNFMFIATSQGFEVAIASAVAIFMYDIQGVFKLYAVMINLKVIKEIKITLDGLMEIMNKEQVLAHAKELVRFRKVSSFMVVNIVASCWLFNIIPVSIIAYVFFTKGIFIKILPYAFWYPYNKTEHFVSTYLYEISTGHVLTVVPPSLDALVMLLTGQLVVLFKCFGENLHKTIDEFEPSRPTQTAEKLNKAVDLHNQLLNMSEELFRIYSIPLLVNVVAQTLTICFVAFGINVRFMF